MGFLKYKKHSKIGTYFPGSRWWKHPDILGIPYDLFRELKAFIHRGRYGWAPSDLWNFDGYLDDVISGGLRTFAENSIGFPGYGRFDTFGKWYDFLYEVIDAIEYDRYLQNESPIDDIKKQMDEEAKAGDRKTALMHQLVNYWGKLWW